MPTASPTLSQKALDFLAHGPKLAGITPGPPSSEATAHPFLDFLTSHTVADWLYMVVGILIIVSAVIALALSSRTATQVITTAAKLA